MKHTAVPFFPAVLIAALGLFLGHSCTKPSPFGQELLDDQRGEYVYTDTLTLQCTLLPEDSLVTSDRSSTSDYLFCGQLNDPVFGKSQSEIYTLFRLESLDPNFKNAQIDSVVLFLAYDPAGFYGDTMLPQTLRVHRLASDTILRWDADYYSNQTLPADVQIGEASNFLPRPNTALTLFDTATKSPYLRIPLDNAFGQELLNTDSVDLTADTAFWKRIRGIRISAEAAASPGAMMAFDLNNNNFSRIRLYYKQDTSSRDFDLFFLGGNKFTHFGHDYSGSTVAPFLNKPADSLLFVQGMGGLRLKVEIPYANLLDSIAVNKAELELTAATLANDNAIFKPASQLIFTELVGDTTYTISSDVLYSLGTSGTSGFNGFGGFPETETDQSQSVQRYRLTFTQRFQDMVDNASGEVKHQTIFVNVYPQSRSAMRTVLYGPKSATFPAKLALKYTKVK